MENPMSQQVREEPHQGKKKRETNAKLKEYQYQGNMRPQGN